MSSLIIRKNKLVSFTYEIWDAEGNMHEKVDIAIKYVHGCNSRLFEQIEAALDGKMIGDYVEVTLRPEESFGYPDPNMVFTDNIHNVPPEFHKLGAEVEMQAENGDVKTFIVTKIEDDQLTVDGNHPLMGKVITFKVTVTDIQDASPSEIQFGEPDEPTLIH